MPPSLPSGSRLFLLGLLARNAFAQTCQSFGVDFQDGGSYFQNSLSTDPFTFVEEFEGCQNDYAENILVDPNGNEYNCTNTPMTPPDTPELSTCAIDKDQLYTGDWSILIISNNGNSTPIAYERDFFLSVGPQITVTYTPTVTVPVTTTSVVNSTTVVTDTSTTTLPVSTVTKPSITISHTRTLTPHRVTTTTTDTLLVTKVIPTVHVYKTTKTITAWCSIPPHQKSPDPTCKITPTLVHAAALEPTSAKFHVREADPLEDKAKFLEERNARIHKLAKRAPDQPTVTSTDGNTSDYPTITSTATTTTILVITSTAETTATVTPSPVVIISGRSTAPVVTITAPTPTRTITKVAINTVTRTTTFSTTITITRTTTPPATWSACRKVGGIIW